MYTCLHVSTNVCVGLVLVIGVLELSRYISLVAKDVDVDVNYFLKHMTTTINLPKIFPNLVTLAIFP